MGGGAKRLEALSEFEASLIASYRAMVVEWKRVDPDCELIVTIIPVGKPVVDLLGREACAKAAADAAMAGIALVVRDALATIRAAEAAAGIEQGIERNGSEPH